MHTPTNKMPYKKRYNKRRSGAHSKYSNVGSYLNTASKALAVAYAVKKLVNVEFRTITTAFTSDPNATGATVNLTAIAQGDDIANRQGNKIRCKHISVKGHIQINGSATISQVRMMIVRDNNGSTTQPTIASLFTSATVFRQGKNKLGDPQTNSRFTVLWDRFVNLDSTNQEQVYIKWSSSLDHHIFFTGTASTNEGKGHMYLFIVSNEATNDPGVSIDAMVKFIDN